MNILIEGTRHFGGPDVPLRLAKPGSTNTSEGIAAT